MKPPCQHLCKPHADLHAAKQLMCLMTSCDVPIIWSSLASMKLLFSLDELSSAGWLLLPGDCWFPINAVKELIPPMMHSWSPAWCPWSSSWCRSWCHWWPWWSPSPSPTSSDDHHCSLSLLNAEPPFMNPHAEPSWWTLLNCCQGADLKADGNHNQCQHDLELLIIADCHASVMEMVLVIHYHEALFNPDEPSPCYWFIYLQKTNPDDGTGASRIQPRGWDEVSDPGQAGCSDGKLIKLMAAENASPIKLMAADHSFECFHPHEPWRNPHCDKPNQPWCKTPWAMLNPCFSTTDEVWSGAHVAF